MICWVVWEVGGNGWVVDMDFNAENEKNERIEGERGWW